MTDNQIRCFIAVAAEKSFSRAANSLYISQPAISKSISKLEAELGFELFELQNREPVLTDAGKLYYSFVTNMLSEYDKVTSEIKDILKTPPHEVRVGCPDTWNPNLLCCRLERLFSASAPGTAFSLEGFRLSELLNRLDSDKLDMVITHNFYSPPDSQIVSAPLPATGCGILCSEEIYGKIKAPKDFAQYDFLIYDERIDKHFSGMLTGICSEYGFEPKLRYSGSITSALFDTARSRGVMLFSDWDYAASNTAFRYYSLGQLLPLQVLYKQGGCCEAIFGAGNEAVF